MIHPNLREHPEREFDLVNEHTVPWIYARSFIVTLTLNFIMEDRDNIRIILIDLINQVIKDKGEDHVMYMSPEVGKNKWTAKEVLEAVTEDECLEDSTYNPIDAYIRFINQYANK